MQAVYPARVEGTLDPGLSRWLWLVKWLLVIPHFIVLAFLWIAFVVLSLVAFFAILFTGRYPRRSSTSTSACCAGRGGSRSTPTARSAPTATRRSRSPSVPDYPATLEVDYPEHLSRGLVLVKWWLLAIPHYLVVAIFLGGGSWIGLGVGRGPLVDRAGLIGVLVLIAAFALLFRGRYPRSIFDFVLGLDRWVVRVAAYVGVDDRRVPAVPARHRRP